MIRKAAYLALGVIVPKTVTKEGKPPKKELIIEWQHVGADILNTCERCGNRYLAAAGAEGFETVF